MTEWDHRTDFLVIGSGAGAVGALRANALGKSALVVEKTDLWGGSTAMSGGVIWMPNNPLMQREGVSDSHDSALDYLDSLVGDVGPASSPERREAYLTEGNEMIYFLESEGVQFIRCPKMSDYYAGIRGYRSGSLAGRSVEPKVFNRKKLGKWSKRIRPGFSPVLNIYTGEGSALQTPKSSGGPSTVLRVAFRTAWGVASGKKYVTNGEALMTRILHALLRRNVPVWLNSPVVELIVEDNRVIGAVVERDGVRLRVQARDGVLIASGGFSRNLAMREKYAGHLGPMSDEWTSANPGDTGEVIEMATGLGAATAMVDEAWWMPTWMDGGKPAMAMTVGAKPHAITVDANGHRFYDESISYQEAGQRIYAHHQSTGAAIPAWLIIDSTHRQKYTFGMMLPGIGHQKWIDAGDWKTADTLEGLAEACGIDADGLTKTVERFNGFAHTGIDEDFHRGEGGWQQFYGDPDHGPNKCLGAVETGPFYAIPIYPGDIGTSGGLMTDEHGRVLRADATPIAGLFATGNCTASVFGRGYPGAGATIGASAVFAYTAANFVGKSVSGKALDHG
ncbi:FAD-binding protein [Rhodococcus koreensis]|uniref:3-oxosteroid 1-dehydrogenase n=1 Tax=Rhodococcus koreensis TaxID=99653 RepID=A0A1H4KYG0_9NOCA|nr:FAD-binding protein [Rhodococcus koreensis]SEB63463.1 3-oxosteroid 1-dehydrogenase [Rhodococcus koreensis]